MRAVQDRWVAATIVVLLAMGVVVWRAAVTAGPHYSEGPVSAHFSPAWRLQRHDVGSSGQNAGFSVQRLSPTSEQPWRLTIDADESLPYLAYLDEYLRETRRLNPVSSENPTQEPFGPGAGLVWRYRGVEMTGNPEAPFRVVQGSLRVLRLEKRTYRIQFTGSGSDPEAWRVAEQEALAAFRFGGGAP